MTSVGVLLGLSAGKSVLPLSFGHMILVFP